MFRRFSLSSRRSSLSNSDTDVKRDVKRDINSAPISKKPCLVIASSSPSIDPHIIQQWTDEGFDVHYARVHGKHRSSTYDVENYGDSLEDGEYYAVVAYDHAATQMLKQAFEILPKLCALIAFYPTTLPEPGSYTPKNLRLQVHLASNQVFAPRYPSFTYANTKPGFDEPDSEEYDRIASGLAWSRSLECVRRGFNIDVDLEHVWEDHLAKEFVTRDAPATLKTMTTHPSVLHLPTLTGGVGLPSLLRFYRDFFIPGNPPSLRTSLLSRTVGSDKVVDEMLISLLHTHEVPWLLPGVPPTGRHIEFVLVSVVKIVGGKLESERLHWDQASVLVQAGLLDARLGAVGLGVEQGGVKMLPIVGGESMRQALEGIEGGLGLNKLIPEW